MTSQPYKGRFITLEGGEGSGKTTLLHQLALFLTAQGFKVVTTREPGGTRLGEAIRDLVLQRNDAMSISTQAELLLFLAARAEHIHEKILPALEAGSIVLCDRFNDSTIAYQGGARGLGIEYVQKLCHVVCGPVNPQLTLFLDIPPLIGLARSRRVQKEQAASGELDRIESETLLFHEKIQASFKSLAMSEPHRFYTINASQSQEGVRNEAISAIEKFILVPDIGNYT